jgi:hypothetical protein
MSGMALDELRRPVPASLFSPGAPVPTEREAALAGSVELYHRTYTTVLRSSGETALRVLEPSHKAMGSSLHPMASSPDPDLGALLYAIRRLPDAIVSADVVLMGQSAEVFAHHGHGAVTGWTEVGAPGRRRRWHDDGEGTLAVLIASASDVDDLIPTMVAFQIEWNKLHTRLQAPAGLLDPPVTADDYATVCGGAVDDWVQLQEVWGDAFSAHMAEITSRPMALRVRMLGGTQVGYARVTRRWWQQVTGVMRSESILARPVYFVSSNSHSLANLMPGLTRRDSD